jgi:uncharacterized protein YndB with AHSA1/START domain
VARNEIFVAAAPDAVFDVLADPRTYSRWVTGTRRVRAADRHWPEPGASLDHEVGLPPVNVKDSTHVMKSDRPRMIELRAQASPLPPARVVLSLHPEGDGTRVTMIEEPTNRLLALLMGPPGHLVLRLRNRETLRRLKALAEGAAQWPQEPLPQRGGGP